MPKVFTSKTQKIGQLGEDIAAMFLMKQGYAIIERNHTKPWGEIDIIAQKGEILHFIEVKSINVPRGTLNNSKVSAKRTDKTSINIRPEENMHPKKLQKLYRTIEIYLSDKTVLLKDTWQVDLYSVFIDVESKSAKVEVVENIVGN